MTQKYVLSLYFVREKKRMKIGNAKTKSIIAKENVFLVGKEENKMKRIIIVLINFY